jgi:hypothetical protein
MCIIQWNYKKSNNMSILIIEIKDNFIFNISRQLYDYVCMHCHDIAIIVCNLWPIVIETKQQSPNFCEVVATR